MCGGGGIGDVGFEFGEGGAEFTVMDLIKRDGGAAGVAIYGGIVAVIALVFVVEFGFGGFLGTLICGIEDTDVDV